MINNARILLAICLMAAAPSYGACPTVGPERDGGDPWGALEEEILGYGSLRDTGFTVGRQKVFRLQPEGERGDALLDRLRRLAPDIEALQAEMSSDPDRAVVLMESRTDGFGESLAFTECPDRDAVHWLEDTFSDMDALPLGACMIVMFPERLSSSRMTDFSLAHEWMHTMQNAAFDQSTDGDDWWREGSADWFAQKIVPGTTERDPVIERFFSRQPDCELVEHSYDAQVFYFWAEALFDAEWVFGQGLAGRDWLRDAEMAAQAMRSEHWLDWAVAQADGDIRFPDGRPLPAGPDVPPVEIGAACKVTVTAPALSAAFREVTLADGASGPLRVEAGASRVAIRGAGEDWVRLTGSAVIDPPPASPFSLAAISPSADRLGVTLMTGAPDAGDCGCYLGRWMEIESDYQEDPLRFRTDVAKYVAMVPDISITYDNAGPILTIRGDGRLTVDDPHTYHFPEGTARFSPYQGYGTWRTENNVIVIEPEAQDVKVQLTSEYLSGMAHDPAHQILGADSKWRPSCDGDGLTLARWMFDPSDPPSEVYHFVPAE